MIAQLPARMQAKITLTDPPVSTVIGQCWTWTGCLSSRGYGCTSVRGKVQLSHRVAYQTITGPIPPGLQIDHLCVNKACCNPAHLEAVTGKVNCERTWAANKPECINGHRFTPENTIVRTRGHLTARACRTCQAASQRRSNRRARAEMAASA